MKIIFSYGLHTKKSYVNVIQLDIQQQQIIDNGVLKTNYANISKRYC